MDYAKNMIDKLNVEQMKIELMNTAYANDNTFIAKLDPRILFIWYGFFGIAPWFIHNAAILTGMLAATIVTTVMTKVSRLILVVLILGILGQGGYLIIATLFFGGDFIVLLPLITLTVKLAVISLASITVFCSMSPEKLSVGLLSIGVPGQVSFSISYGYRMLPLLLEEYNHVFMSYRLRGRAPQRQGFLYWRITCYFIKLAVLSFYPLLLSIAKRARTTVEALETKGSRNAFKNPDVKKLKLQSLKIRKNDYVFLAISSLYVISLFLFS
ncbi:MULTISPECIES: energy-coupling factor transporter transmembrane component T [Bacillaceae]|uniref:energy-coupling factor transporter transmembrane component T family protein n=1 Tax=Bacillaceae TaxID=186817 RepID=UPI001E317ECC|nr:MULTISPECIES: energy-coupling factor transporter transmembrane component T [Bacillaceae]MCE4049220.1 energy-coupling factor transporter transmembrane protein EcfT [Bacillus sp. Au-Bac7]UPO90350.1 energy-coupling factor transporter transmembrane protein EcfT [Niallia sp. Man26]